MLVELIDYSYYNKVSLILLLPLVLVFFMCMVDLTRTKYLFRSLFSNNYFYKYPYDSISKITLYQVLMFLYISIVFSFFLMFLMYKREFIYQNFLEAFRNSLLISAAYFFVKYLVSEFLYNASNKKAYFKQMLVLETSYLVVVLLVVFFVLCYVFLHLNYYEWMRKSTLIIALIMYSYRLIVLISNNKNLLSGKILFIILYLCTLEIVPFIYLFKSYTE
ncbi:DUF4271 domain-containing protein [Wenyingzhuangia sp. IMCC45467]